MVTGVAWAAPERRRRIYGNKSPFSRTYREGAHEDLGGGGVGGDNSGEFSRRCQCENVIQRAQREVGRDFDQNRNWDAAGVVFL